MIWTHASNYHFETDVQIRYFRRYLLSPEAQRHIWTLGRIAASRKYAGT